MKRIAATTFDLVPNETRTSSLLSSLRLRQHRESFVSRRGFGSRTLVRNERIVSTASRFRGLCNSRHSVRNLTLCKSNLCHPRQHRCNSSTSSPDDPSTIRDSVNTMRQRLADAAQKETALWPHDDPWESLWKDGITPWDLGKPTHALSYELARSSRRWNRSSDSLKSTTLRTLVPGCGAGYDLITLMQHHDNLIASDEAVVREACIVGLDVSSTSLARAADNIEAALEFCPLDRPTKVKLVKGDYFAESATWELIATYGGSSQRRDGRTTTTASGGSKIYADCSVCRDSLVGTTCFDLIYDYTFFCALHPSRRNEWGQRTAELLCPIGGQLLTLMFPVMFTDDEATKGRPELRGPPYPVWPQAYRDVLEPHGVVVESNAYECPETDPTRVGMELVCWWKRSQDVQLHSKL